MKSVILSALVTLFILPSAYQINAQTVEQGIWTAGGSVSVSSSKQQGAGSATSVISLLPEGGYFIIDDLGIGINGAYSKTSQNGASLTELAFGPWARYYFYQNTFAQAGYMLGTSTISGDFGKAKSSNSKMDVSLGYSAWLADAVALEPMIFYTMSKSRDESENPVNINSFGLRLGLKIFIGM